MRVLNATIHYLIPINMKLEQHKLKRILKYLKVNRTSVAQISNCNISFSDP